MRSYPEVLAFMQPVGKWSTNDFATMLISGRRFALNQAVGECSTNAFANVLSYPVVLLLLTSRSANGAPMHSRICCHIGAALLLLSTRSANEAPMHARMCFHVRWCFRLLRRRSPMHARMCFHIRRSFCSCLTGQPMERQAVHYYVFTSCRRFCS